MDKDTILKPVCEMADDHRRLGNLSMFDLLDASRYGTCHVDIRESDIEAYLRANPRLVEEWLIHSGDNRSTPAWYILPPGNEYEKEMWVVGYYPGEKKRRFADKFRACAYYVKNYLDGMQGDRTISS